MCSPPTQTIETLEAGTHTLVQWQTDAIFYQKGYRSYVLLFQELIFLAETVKVFRKNRLGRLLLLAYRLQI